MSSFPGDILFVLSLAKQLHRKCRAAHGEYLEVAHKVSSLHTILRHLRYENEAPGSLLNLDRSKHGAQLVSILENCDYTLRRLDELLRKYGKPADQQSPIWERIRSGSAEMDALGDIRSKLNIHKTIIRGT